MAKFVVFNKAKKEEKEVFFRLEQVGDEICLMACNVEGNRFPYGTILTLKEDGSVLLNARGQDVPGIKYDNEGHIKCRLE